MLIVYKTGCLIRILVLPEPCFVAMNKALLYFTVLYPDVNHWFNETSSS
jgi:hypothetical protein